MSDAPTLVRVRIVYCAACGYEPQALELARALMYEFTYGLEAIEIIPWAEGTFDVAVDGELVHAMLRDGSFPANQKIIDAVRQRLNR